MISNFISLVDYTNGIISAIIMLVVFLALIIALILFMRGGKKKN
jgi:uncharacterized protein HemY